LDLIPPLLATNDPQIWNGIPSVPQIAAVVKSVRVVNSANMLKAKGTSSILALDGTPHDKSHRTSPAGSYTLHK